MGDFSDHFIGNGDIRPALLQLFKLLREIHAHGDIFGFLPDHEPGVGLSAELLDIPDLGSRCAILHLVAQRSLISADKLAEYLRPIILTHRIQVLC